MCGLQLGDSYPSLSAKPRGSLIMQRIAEFKALLHLWGMFGRGQSHTPEGFRPLQKMAVWAWLGDVCVRNIWHKKYIHKLQSDPFCSIQIATLPHWECRAGEGAQPASH